MTSADITLGADEVSEQKKFWFGEIRAVQLKSGCVNPPGPLQLCALCVGAVGGVPQLNPVGCAVGGQDSRSETSDQAAHR